MAIRRKQETREQKRFTRSSTNRGFVLKRPAHLGALIAITLTVLAVVALALLCGSYLKEKSDAYREAVSNRDWNVGEPAEPLKPTTVPDIRAISIRPGGNVGDILIAGKHDGIILPLGSIRSTLCYPSEVGARAQIPVETESPELSDDVKRIQNRDLNVTCTMTLTCFSEQDASMAAYVRGLELAILHEYARAGMNDLLLFGLPCGTKEADTDAVAFLQELRALLLDLPDPPAIGVALPLAAFQTDETYTPSNDPAMDEMAGIPEDAPPQYAGNMTPGRILWGCDYLALDLGSMESEGIDAVLPHIRYAYVRYSLRILVPMRASAAISSALERGFERIFETDVP